MTAMDAAPPRAPAGPLPTAFAASVFASAALLFVVQPMFAKMTLPLLGGAPGVWTVAMVFFQGALLAGYAYAHALARLASLKVQARVHAGVLLLAALSLPLGVSGALGDPSPEAPTFWLFGLMALSVGAPFAALSATAPLLQSWYARTDRPDAHDPYHLYVASNAGSLLALVAYPLVLEPFLPVSVQTLGWSLGYGVVSLALIGCGVLALKVDQGAAQDAALTEESATPARSRWVQRAVWTGLAAIPSSLLLGATAHISTDVAAAPFLWAPPLILYLLTFIVAFSKRPLINHQIASWIYAAVALAAAPLLSLILPPVEWGLALNLAVVFFGALVCHHALAARRPHAARLTEFYFFLSLGGVMGGLFNALAAPVLFDTVVEYPIAIVLCLLGLKAASAPKGGFSLPARLTLLAAAGAALLVEVGADAMGQPVEQAVFGAALAVGCAAALLLLDRPILITIAAGLVLTASVLHRHDDADFRDRSFFGVLKVSTEPVSQVRWLAHGTTLHGSQSLAPGDELRPVSYYAVEGPLGGALVAKQNQHPLDVVGVVGLGAGSMACHAIPGERWRFHEIDPMVARVATDPAYFTFAPACTPDAEIVLGDARLTLQQAPDGLYDVLVMDAFTSDTVPAHLMTREAVRMFLAKLKPDGLLLFHISNRHMALRDVLARVAAAEGAVMLFNNFEADTDQDLRHISSADVLAIARDARGLSALAGDPAWVPVEVPPGRPWTDDYSNVLGAIIDKKIHGRD